MGPRRKRRNSDSETYNEENQVNQSNLLNRTTEQKGEANMERFCQFGLLLRKDFILLRRNKVWTIFELVIPALLLSLIIYPVVKNAETTPSGTVIFDPFPLQGTIEDVFYEPGHSKSVYRRWCTKTNVIFGYTAADSQSFSIADEIMTDLSKKYQSNKMNLKVQSEKNESDLLRILKDDMPLNNETYCAINNFVGGVVFDQIDKSKKILKYRIFIGRAREENWHLTETWDTPYGAGSGRNNRYPSEPPYWTAGFLTLQHAIETAFVESLRGFEVPESSITFQGLPDPPYKTNSISHFIQFFPFIFAFLSFINVVHVTREIAAENGSVKPFLTAMGLSTSMFYLAHVFVAFIKFLIIFLITAIPLITVLEFVSPTVLFLSLFFYGAGAVMFGAFVASFFENTNSAIKAILFAWGAMLGIAWKLFPKTHEISACFLYALNINGAFTLAIEAISDYMRRERELNMFNMFADSSLQFSLGWSLVMMIVDVCWMWIATMLVDYIRTSADFSLRSLFSSKDRMDEYETQPDGVTAQNTRINQQIQMNTLGSSSSSLNPPNIDSDALLEGSTEIDGARDHARADIIVSRLVKIWSTTGERAVDGLSLRAMRGQVSILLGHNGAGKSTTFASIAGIIRPTYGSVSICGKDVVSQGSKTKGHVGLCPQYNPLYEKLTVEEHLWLVNGLKGANKRGFNNEMDRLLKDVKLDLKKNEWAMNLSGGMKRKLCVCMALIGESEVVLLDEPTAGMDPGARKDVQELLEREKNNRTILLTTHYMDEAERLGDWIFIMSHGRLVASGTNQYLKQKFGTGFLLTVVLDHSGEKRKMAEVLTGVCQHFVEGAERGDLHGQQIEIILPEKQKHTFVDLFRALEAIQERDFKSDALSSVPNQLKSQLAVLMMTNFGLSLNTLEQVFITIGDKVEQVMASRQNSRVSHHSNSLKPPGYDTQTSTKSADSYQRLMDSQARGPDQRGARKVVSQFLSILRKKFLYSYRNWTQLVGQVIVPLILLGCVASLSTLKSSNTDQVRKLTIEHLEPTKVVWRVDTSKIVPRAEGILRIIKRVPGFEVLNYSETEPLLNITTNLIGEMPPAGFGLTIESAESDNLILLFNQRAYHVLPTLVSLVNRARLSADGPTQTEPTIESGIWLYSKDESGSQLLPSNLIDVLLTPMLILIFAMVTSTFVMFLIEERESMFAHQQFLTGISPITFYSSSFFYDFVLYSIICTVFLFIFVAFEWMVNHFTLVFLFWFLYFISSVPFIYAVSFLFASPSKANVMLIIWQVIISGTALIAVFILFTLIPMNKTVESFIKNVFLFFLPSYSFGAAILTINTYGQILTNEQLLEWDMIGKNAVLMLCFGIVSFAMFVALQFKPIRKALSQVWTIRRSPINNVQPMMTDLPHCDSVDRERELVHRATPTQYALIVKDLTKQFGKMTAVNELSLAVDQKECFGLLGVNGAGKTTTFNILTGQSFATSGDATIGGRDVTEQISIGYCPQFDALLLDLTGREILEILGQMHGFGNYKAKADLVLECVGMLDHADKLVRFYSGGQKRKISVGVALLAPTQMIILDEPTAGIDPKARREVWELLLWCREHSNSALMLTSHSMDECEALCSRIAVLNRGSLIAIGTSQDLKSLYGNNYTMTLSLNHIEDREEICRKVSERLPNSVLKTTKTNRTLNLKWQIPKSPGDHWSTQYAMVQELAKSLNVKDYILAQSSLEETFLRLAGLDDDKDQVDNGPVVV